MQRLRQSFGLLSVLLLAVSVFVRVACADGYASTAASSASSGPLLPHSGCHDPASKKPSSPSSRASQQECCAAATGKAAPSARYVTPTPLLASDDSVQQDFAADFVQPASDHQEVFAGPPGWHVLRI